MTYTFLTELPEETPETHWCVEGDILLSDDTPTLRVQKCETLPEETQNPSRLRDIYTCWIQDCSGAFVRPPTVTQCLANTKSVVDLSGGCVSVGPEDLDDDWQLLWVPTQLVLTNQPLTFQLGWAPLYSKIATRIPEFPETPSEIHTVQITHPEIQLERPTRLPATLSDPEWLQELTDIQVPFTNAQTLRLQDPAQEKMRKRIREARIRAKLARYRADRLAAQYERKYGEWPEEDAEEAETDVGSGSDEFDGLN